MKSLKYFFALFLCAGLAQAETKTKAVAAGDLKLNIPETWAQEKVRSNMRVAQFSVPAADKKGEAAELVIFYFGRQSGGGVEANIERWIGQFEAEGRDAKRDKGDSANGKYNLVNIVGTYNKPIGPPFARKTQAAADYQMLAAIIATDKGNYFLKFTGPKKTVSAAEKDFKASFGAK